MTVKTAFCASLVLGMLAPFAAAQVPDYSNGTPQPAPVPQSVMESQSGLSDWITYRRGGYCMGPVGGHGPIGSEVYLRGGIDFPVGGNLGDILRPGHSIQGGGRALLFNQAEDAAWTIDVGLANIYNYADGGAAPFTITQPGGAVVVNMTSMNRTFFSLGFGRQWYLWGSAPDPVNKWLIGFDLGGRYGSASANFAQIRHRTDVVGGGFISGYGGIEIPVAFGFLEAGVRTEFSYTWSDIVQVPSDIADIGVLFNVGLRF